MQTSLQVPQGQFKLNRYPIRNNDQLRAWDAADELVLEHLNSLAQEQPLYSPKALIINDHFGALSVALHTLQPTLVSDSYIAKCSTDYNLKQNKLPAIHFLSSVDNLQGPYDLVIIKVQKSLAQLEDQLYKLREHLHEGSVIIGCAMVKMIHTSNIKLFESIIGATKTSLAKKKARLIFCKYNNTLVPKINPHPLSYQLDNSDWQILNHANVFSRAKLDIGCRFFIEHIPSSPEIKNIIDLGCGNGIVGMIAAQRNPNANVDFYDESYMAIASAEHNFTQAFGTSRSASFKVDDCLSTRAAHSADLVLNNPPFHQQNAIGDFIAWQMFSQSQKALKVSGELWVIGNTHLGYQAKLKQIFGNCDRITSNSKFVILRAIKQAKGA